MLECSGACFQAARQSSRQPHSRSSRISQALPAIALFTQLTLADEFEDFLTVHAYDVLDAGTLETTET